MRKKEIKLEINEALYFKIMCALPEKITIDDVVASLLEDYFTWLTTHNVIERVKDRGPGCLERE